MHKIPEDELPGPPLETSKRLADLHGADRSGLGEKGWAEVPEDRIGGHPELEVAPAPGDTGGVDGPQAETDVKTGALKSDGVRP